MIVLIAVAAALAAASPLGKHGDATRVLIEEANNTYWWKYPGSDCPYEDANATHNPGQPISVYIQDCLNTPGCFGFNTNGVLKNETCYTTVVSGQPCDLYLMESIPQPTTAFPYIWPMPQQFTNGSANISVNANGFSFQTNVTSVDLDNAIQRYQQLLFPHPAAATSSPSAISGVVINVVNTTAPLQLYVDESYSIEIPSTSGLIIITAGTVYGAYHALESLSQLMQFNFGTETYFIPFAPWNIFDFPRFAHRALLVDSSRHFEPVETIKGVIDSLTYAKLNCIHWHLVDEQSFPFDSPSFPLLSEKGAYSNYERYSVDEIAQVIEYARQRGVRVMVEIDTPGHAQSWCYGYPDICPSLACPMPLNPASEETFQVLQGLFFDLTGGVRGSGLFFENLMHLGGDEVDTSCWNTSTTIVAWLEANNFTTEQAYAYFVARAQSIAIAYGRDVVGWEEIWDNFGTKLNPSTIIEQWLPGSTIGPQVVAAGYRLIWATDGIWYLDGLSVTWQQMYVAEPCTDIPDNLNHLVLGGEGCMWGETVDTSDIQQTIWPRLGAIAERLWSSRSLTNTQAAEPRLSYFRCLLNRRGIAAAPLDNAEARESPPGPGSCFDQ